MKTIAVLCLFLIVGCSFGPTYYVVADSYNNNAPISMVPKEKTETKKGQKERVVKKTTTTTRRYIPASQLPKEVKR